MLDLNDDCLFVFRERHVETWVRSGSHYVLIDWYAQGVDVMAVDMSTFVAINRSLGASVLRLRQQQKRWRYPLLATCVGVAKHVAGIRSWAVTANQLRKALIRAGAVEVTHHGSEEAGQDPGAEGARADAAASAPG